jgi:hypothetical protein
MATLTAPILSPVVRDSAASAGRRLRETAQPAAGEVQGLLELHHLLADLLRRSWESARGAMVEGIEAGRLRSLLEPIRDGAAALLDLLPLLRNQDGAAQAHRADLEADAGKVRAVHEGAAQLLDWLAAPRPPVDEDQLAQSRRDIEQGRVESGDSILARLRAGEDV